MDLIAKYWSVFLGMNLTEEDVATLMILLKVARMSASDWDDNLVDIAGYAALIGELNE